MDPAEKSSGEKADQRDYKTLSDISDYFAAKLRFEGSTGLNKMEDYLTEEASDLTLEEEYTTTILRICNGITSKSYRLSMDFVFDMLVYSDYIQIAVGEMVNFYDGVVENFFARRGIVDVMDNIKKLNQIPQVKAHLIRALLRSLGMSGIIKPGVVFILAEKPKVNHGDQTVIDPLTDLNSAYYVEIVRLHWGSCDRCMCAQESVFRFNLFLRLLNVYHLQFNHCKFDEEEITQLLTGLTLKTLEFYKCTVQVGNLFNNLLPAFVEHLRELRIIGMIIENDILRMIRHIPLETLILTNSCLVINNPKNPQITLGLGVPHFDCLWEEGILRDTLKRLRISLDNIPRKVLAKFWRSKSNICENRMRNSGFFMTYLLGCLGDTQDDVYVRRVIDVPTFRRICDIPLESLKMCYRGHSSDNYTECYGKPLTQTLKSLSLSLSSSSSKFFTFISTIELKRLNVWLKTSVNELKLDAFLNDYHEQRAHLRTLIIKIDNPELALTERFARGLRNTVNLRKFSLWLNKQPYSFRTILSLPNLQKTLKDLTLRGAMLKEEDLENLLKFQNLRVLHFQYDANVSEGTMRRFMNKMGSITLTLNPFSNFSCDSIKIERLNDIISSYRAKKKREIPERRV